MSYIHPSITTSSLGFLFALCAAACSSESSSPLPNVAPDSGASPTGSEGASTDIASSSTSDTDVDGGATGAPASGEPDSGATTSNPPSSPDAGNDGTGSSHSDGGVDESPGEDAGTTGGDGPGSDSAGDGGVVDPWADCPTAVEPQNANWPLRINATEDAVYCALFNENRTLLEEKAAKMQLRIAPGVHRVPDVDTTSLAFPACVRDVAKTISVESGSLTVTKSTGEGNTSYMLGFSQELGSNDPRRFEMRLDQSFDDGATVEFVLNGAETDELESYQSMDLCDVDGEYCFPNIIFSSCAYESGELNTHTVEFGGGQVTFELRIGESFAGTEPGAFVAAAGHYLNEEFTQDDYFKLIYHPAHHHFERAFVVLFDEPRGEVCGIEVSGLEPFGDDVPDAAYTVDCDLDHLDELEITSHTLVRSAP